MVNDTNIAWVNLPTNAHLTTSWIVNAGRAFAIRTLLKIGGVDFVDERISMDEFKQRKGEATRTKEIPLGQLPVLTLPTGTIVTQSFAISRYAGKLAKLYPEDPLEALLVDEIIDVDSDILNGVPRNLDAEALKTKREEYAAGKLNTYFSFLAEKLEASSGPFFSGNKYTAADIHVYFAIKMFRMGILDHIPSDYDSKWPVLGAFVDALERDPVFAPHKF